MADINWTAPHTGSSESVSNVEVLWITESVFVVCWVDAAGTGIKANIYSSNGTWLHSQALFTYGLLRTDPIQLAKVRDNEWVIAFAEDVSYEAVRLYHFTWTGSSITNHGQIAGNVAQQNRTPAVCNIGEDKIMLWSRRFDLANGISGKYLTYDGSTWSVGTSNSVIGGHYADRIRACTAEEDKGVLFWDKDPNDDGMCHGFGTTAGGGSDISGIEGTRSIHYFNACRLADNRIILCTRSYDDVDYTGRAYAVTLENESLPHKPTIGAAFVFYTGANTNNHCVPIDATHFLVAYEDQLDSSKGKTRLCTVNWDTRTITANDVEIFSSNNIGSAGLMGIGMASNSSGIVALSYRDNSDSSYVKTMVGTEYVLTGLDSSCSIITSISTTELTLGSNEVLSSANVVLSDATASLTLGAITPISTTCNIYSDATSLLETSPPPPENFSAEASGVYNIELTWDASIDATSYNVYWLTSSGVDTTSGNKISGITTTSHEITLTPGHWYYFIVTAENWVGESPASSEISATLSRYSEFKPSPLPSDLGSILNSLTDAYGNPINYAGLTTRASSNADKKIKLDALADVFSETLPQHFLYDNEYSVEELLTTLSPDLKTSIDSLFSTGEGDVAINNLLRTLDGWIQDEDNIGGNAPNVEVVLRGLGSSEQKALLDLIKFFKPYRSRLVFIGSSFTIDNALTESVISEDTFNQLFDMEFTFGFDYITAGLPACDNPRAGETIPPDSTHMPDDSTSTPHVTQVELYEILDSEDVKWNYHGSDSTTGHYEDWTVSDSTSSYYDENWIVGDSTSYVVTAIVADGFCDWDDPNSFFDHSEGSDIVTITVTDTP